MHGKISFVHVYALRCTLVQGDAHRTNTFTLLLFCCSWERVFREKCQIFGPAPDSSPGLLFDGSPCNLNQTAWILKKCAVYYICFSLSTILKLQLRTERTQTFRDLRKDEQLLPRSHFLIKSVKVQCPVLSSSKPTILWESSCNMIRDNIILPKTKL